MGLARSEESVGVGGTGGGSMDDGRGRMEWAEERESQSPTHLPTGWLVCAEEHGVVAAWAAVRERLVEELTFLSSLGKRMPSEKVSNVRYVVRIDTKRCAHFRPPLLPSDVASTVIYRVFLPELSSDENLKPISQNRIPRIIWVIWDRICDEL